MAELCDEKFSGVCILKFYTMGALTTRERNDTDITMIITN